MKKIVLSAVLLLGMIAAKAQQDPEYNMYMFNGLFINPAYAGSKDVISLVGIYRHQWDGIDGAPRTVNVSVHSPLKKEQYALGLTIANDRLGLTNQFSATGAFAYRLRFKKDLIWAFGIQAGVTYFQQRNSNAITESAVSNSVFDPSFKDNISMVLPNIGAGTYLYNKRFFVGFSVPHLIPYSLSNSNKYKLNPNNESLAKMYNQYILTAGYVFGKDNAIVKVRPSIMMNYQQGLQRNIPDFHFNLGLLFIDRVWLAASVRTGGEKYNASSTKAKPFNVEGIVGMIQGKVTPQLEVGYAYHYPISDLRQYQRGTHEVMLGYDFWYNKKRFVTPRYVKYF